MSAPNWMLSIAILASAGSAAAEDASLMTQAAQHVRSEFRRLDVNHDSILGRDEFLKLVEDQAVGKRDFQLFDFNKSGDLSQSEFATVSGLVDPRFRGTMPDPMSRLLNDAIVALDQSYDRWDLRPQELVSAHTFVSNFLDSITPRGKRFVTGRVVDQADRNADGRISRSEGRFFLEQQLGFRLHIGPPLREPTGRLLRYDRFIEMDRDQNRLLSREEFHSGWHDENDASEIFARIDDDQSGDVTFFEFAHPGAPTFYDPIEWFRSADRNYDAELSRDEALAATPESRLHLTGSTFASFDDDGNGMLSLSEYRMSMLANFNYPWDRRPKDRNRNGLISYDEFRFDELDLFPLQRLYFFHRLDLNRDGVLRRDEYDFRFTEPLTVRAYPRTGGESRVIYRNAKFPECGGVSVSHDGSMLILHHAPPDGLSGGEVIRVSLDDVEMRVLCDGIRPSWAPDGIRFACERHVQDDAIWLMDGSGLQGQRIAGGHSPKWSPDGQKIAFLSDNGISLYVVATGEIQSLFMREDHPYQDLGKSISWSPDSAKIAVVGNFASSSQLVILDATRKDGAETRIRFSFDSTVRTDLTWNQLDGIVLGIRATADDEFHIVMLDPDSLGEPTPLSSIPQADRCRSACLSPDGKWYIAVTEN